MQMFKINRMIALAMVSCLPIAGGSGSPTAPDVSGFDGTGDNASALGRGTVSAPSLSIVPSPVPDNGGNKPAPAPQPNPSPAPNNDPTNGPTNQPGPVFQPSPSPVPDNGGNKPAPAPQPNPSPAPNNDPTNNPPNNGPALPPVTNGDTGNTPPGPASNGSSNNPTSPTN